MRFTPKHLSTLLIIITCMAGLATAQTKGKVKSKKKTQIKKTTAIKPSSNTTTQVVDNNQQLNIVTNFGAIPNDGQSDHEAFIKASKAINAIGKNVTLTIPKGKYLVGDLYEITFGRKAKDALQLNSCSNIIVKGEVGSIIQYMDNLPFGSFDPDSKKATTTQNSGNYKLANSLEHCINLIKCDKVLVTQLELDGNNEKINFGGGYGDIGFQLPHYGIFISNSTNITISKINSHNFCLDGITVANKTPQGEATKSQNILLQDCSFVYNTRQGMSWIGGKGLIANNCVFSYTGTGKYHSSPGAGIDIEPEIGLVRDGVFNNCKFEHNNGVGVLASVGDSKSMTFNNCIIWGSNNWSIWTEFPNYNFNNCTIHGSTVWGCKAEKDEDATKFTNCTFEDKMYKGKPSYGRFLVESNDAKRMSFKNCTFNANYTKAFWMVSPGKYKVEEYYRLESCKINMNYTGTEPGGIYLSIINSTKFKDVVFNINAKRSVLQKNNRSIWTIDPLIEGAPWKENYLPE